jgi:PrcB C-terminal
MPNYKSGLMTGLILLGQGVAGAPACSAGPEAANQRDNSAHNQSPQQSGSAEVVRQLPDGRKGEMKVLAEGSYGQVSDPFVAVTRDPKVYSALRGMVGELPALGEEFFRANSVVAVFTGLRNTGGHSVELAQTGGGRVLVSERTPPADAMTTQAITKPFKVVAVPTKEDEDITLILQGGLAASLLRPYRVTSGDFTSAEGTHGRAQKFRLEGALRVARQEGLATVFFDLKGVGATGPSVLQAVATGIVGGDGRFSVASLDAGTLVGRPSGRLRVAGNFTDDGEKLQVAFESLPRMGADGFSGSGKLAAQASGPAPRRAQPDASIY